MGSMNVEVLVLEGCPHEASAQQMLRAALTDVGLESASFTTTIIGSQREAEARGFVGSPTFSVDGRDLFPEPASPRSLACRLYAGGDGLPELRDLRRSLKRAAAASR
jgi:hypothetical protein